MTTTTHATLPTVPALDLDRRLGGSPSLRVRQERRVVWALLHHLEAHGWKAAFVDSDGDREAVTSAKDVMELVFNLDEAMVRFAHPEHPKRSSVFFVMGNHPTEVVCDYSTADGFDTAVEAFKPESVL